MTKAQGSEVSRQQPNAGPGVEKHGLFDLLRRDHERLREYFKKIEKSAASQLELRKELLAVLEQELLLHMEAEERFFYTALEQHEEARGKALESYEEHQVARTVIGAFTGLAADDERWPAKLKVLGDLVRHHLEEEETGLFQLAQKVLSKEQLAGIALKVQEVKYDPRHTFTEKTGNSGKTDQQ